MAAVSLRFEERVGLAVALAAHVALLLLLVLRPHTGDVVMPPERIDVTLSDDVGLISTSPDPYADAAPDVAPMIGEALQSEPLPVEAEQDPPVTTEAEPPPSATSRRTQQATSQPRPQPSAAPRRSERSGRSRVGSDFLEGASNSDSGSAEAAAASFGPREQASLASTISRQLRPHWSAPQGADAELLVTLVRFNLARDGSLEGEPRVVGQSGRTDANTNQMGRHAEQAVRAVKLAAPFQLPQEYYSHWKTITSRFDRNLSR